MEDLREVIERIYNEVIPFSGKGKVADYIPALAEVNPRQLAIVVDTLDHGNFKVGDSEVPFSIQSISKVYVLSMVASHLGEELWTSVGREPSGNPFNSLVQLEYEHGIPRNPFINAGALVVTDRLIDLYPRPKEALLEVVRQNADRNMALAYFMKSFGNIHNDVETVIDVYCHQCSIAMSCSDLARSFLMFANKGVNPLNGERVLTESRSKRIGALMATCGFYDESGDFAYRVGLPGKSGVGGGIVAYMPGKLTMAVWSPALNSYGNSIAGIEAFERFTTSVRSSIF